MSLVDDILSSNLYCTLATVCEDGSPWASPVFFAHQENKIIWWSGKNAVHSKNIVREGKVFIAVFDSQASEGKGRGMYIQAAAKMIEDENEIKEAISIYTAKSRVFKPTLEDSSGDAPTRFFRATIQKTWTNVDGKESGKFVDLREELK